MTVAVCHRRLLISLPLFDVGVAFFIFELTFAYFGILISRCEDIDAWVALYSFLDAAGVVAVMRICSIFGFLLVRQVILIAA